MHKSEYAGTSPSKTMTRKAFYETARSLMSWQAWQKGHHVCLAGAGGDVRLLRAMDSGPRLAIDWNAKTLGKTALDCYLDNDDKTTWEHRDLRNLTGSPQGFKSIFFDLCGTMSQKNLDMCFNVANRWLPLGVLGLGFTKARDSIKTPDGQDATALRIKALLAYIKANKLNYRLEHTWSYTSSVPMVYFLLLRTRYGRHCTHYQHMAFTETDVHNIARAELRNTGDVQRVADTYELPVERVRSWAK